mmetsp:Transcript_4505/g.14159  ORF Transcript_4505/g.14159 Transcript_4505/m.14159 type:complete len:314 (+) Transcript_4505:1849-2790(+)
MGMSVATISGVWAGDAGGRRSCDAADRCGGGMPHARRCDSSSRASRSVASTSARSLESTAHALNALPMRRRITASIAGAPPCAGRADGCRTAAKSGLSVGVRSAGCVSASRTSGLVGSRSTFSMAKARIEARAQAAGGCGKPGSSERDIRADVAPSISTGSADSSPASAQTSGPCAAAAASPAKTRCPASCQRLARLSATAARALTAARASSVPPSLEARAVERTRSSIVVKIEASSCSPRACTAEPLPICQCTASRSRAAALPPSKSTSDTIAATVPAAEALAPAAAAASAGGALEGRSARISASRWTHAER